MKINASSCLNHSIWLSCLIFIFAWLYNLVHIVLLISRCLKFINFRRLLNLLRLSFSIKLVPTGASYPLKLFSKIATTVHLSFWKINFSLNVVLLVVPVSRQRHPSLSLWFLVGYLVTLSYYWTALWRFVSSQTGRELERRSCLLIGGDNWLWVYCRIFVAIAVQPFLWNEPLAWTAALDWEVSLFVQKNISRGLRRQRVVLFGDYWLH